VATVAVITLSEEAPSTSASVAGTKAETVIELNTADVSSPLV